VFVVCLPSSPQKGECAIVITERVASSRKKAESVNVDVFTAADHDDQVGFRVRAVCVHLELLFDLVGNLKMALTFHCVLQML